MTTAIVVAFGVGMLFGVVATLILLAVSGASQTTVQPYRPPYAVRNGQPPRPRLRSPR